MSTFSEKLYSRFGLLALAALGLAVILLSNALFRSWRLDLTENNLYSISDGTKNILRSIDEPINLYYFFSDSTSGNATALRAYAQRVREVLEEFSLVAGGKVRLQVIDPLPFSEEEDQAAQFGLQAVPIGGTGETVYFGLAGTNAVDDQSVVPFFQAEKEAFLEYDLAKLVHSLANPARPVIGLLSTLPLDGGFDPATMQRTPGWMISDQLKQLFELRTIESSATSIDAEVDVLMLVHPKGLSDATLYAIDQFILGGGRALVFVDPFAEVDAPPQDPNNPAAMFSAVRASNLSKMFDVWGVKFDDTRFVADDRFALTIGDPRSQQQVRHLGFLGLVSDGLDRNDVVTGDLNSVNVGYGGAFSLADDASATLSPLIVSSAESALLSADQLRFMPDPDGLRRNYAADADTYMIAARIQGNVKSAFEGGPPEDAEAGGEHLNESAAGINVIAVGDVDMLTDRFWVQVQNFFGQRLASAFANNGDFVFNALDNLTGDSDLISIRGRASYRRPFDRVEELTRKADEQFRTTEERLQEELAQTEKRLGELQANRDDENTLIVSDEQRAEIEQFLEQKLRIRKELRQVRRNLDKDIKQLGTRLKAINIAAMPLAVVAFAIAMGRRRTRRASRQRGSDHA